MGKQEPRIDTLESMMSCFHQSVGAVGNQILLRALVGMLLLHDMTVSGASASQGDDHLMAITQIDFHDGCSCPRGKEPMVKRRRMSETGLHQVRFSLKLHGQLQGPRVRATMGSRRCSCLRCNMPKMTMFTSAR